MGYRESEKISYELSKQEALELYSSLPVVGKLVDIDVLCLADYHLVVNLEQFVSPKRRLTAYAKMHPDECCIGVIRRSDSKALVSEKSRAVLDMMIDASSFMENAELKPDNQSKEEKNEESAKLIAEKKRLAEEISKLPPDLGGSIKKLMKDRNYTIEKLSEDSGLSEGTIKTYRGKPLSDYKKKNIVAISIAMHLHPWITEELLRKARLEMSSVEPDLSYCLLYTYYYKATLWECNDIIGKELFKRAS